jgi:hypothetical protein
MDTRQFTAISSAAQGQEDSSHIHFKRINAKQPILRLVQSVLLEIVQTFACHSSEPVGTIDLLADALEFHL